MATTRAAVKPNAKASNTEAKPKVNQAEYHKAKLAALSKKLAIKK